MKRLIFTILTTAFIANSSFAIETAKDDSTCGFSLEKMYIVFGGGYVLTSHNSSTTANSNNLLIDVNTTSALFNLQNVNWRNTLSNGYEINLALGRNVCPCWRVEGEFLYQNLRRRISGHYDFVQIDSLGGDVFSPSSGIISGSEKTMNVYALMGNVYYDFKKVCNWKPYLGAGIGLARIKSTVNTINDFLSINDITSGDTGLLLTQENTPAIYNTVLAWQLKAGLAYQFDDHFSILGQYRLFGTSGYRTKSTTIILSSDSPSPAIFRIPGGDARGLLNSGFDLSFKYDF